MSVAEHFTRISESDSSPGSIYNYGKMNEANWTADNVDAWMYFNFDARKVIEAYLEKLQTTGEKVFRHIDICGSAKMGNPPDFEEYYFRYGKGRNPAVAHHPNLFQGDFLDFTGGNSFDQMVKTLREKGVKFNVVTFQPRGGLIEFKPDLIMSHTGITKRKIEHGISTLLVRRLLKIAGLIEKDGFFYMGSFFALDEYFQKIFNDKHVLSRFGLEVVGPTRDEMGRTAILLKKNS